MAEKTLSPDRKPTRQHLNLSTRTRYRSEDGYYGLPKIDRMIDARRTREVDADDAARRRERIQERWTLYREGQRLAHIMLPIIKARGAVPKHDQGWINTIARLYTCAYPRPEGDTNARLAVMLDALRRAYANSRDREIKAKAADPLAVVLVAPIPRWLHDPITLLPEQQTAPMSADASRALAAILPAVEAWAVHSQCQRIRIKRDSTPTIKLFYTSAHGLRILNKPQRRRVQRCTNRKTVQNTGFLVALPLAVFPDSLECRRIERELATVDTVADEKTRAAILRYCPRMIERYRAAAQMYRPHVINSAERRAA